MKLKIERNKICGYVNMMFDFSLDTLTNDIYSRLEPNKAEVTFLLESIVKGNIEGSIYAGKCSCLVGTLLYKKFDFDEVAVNRAVVDSHHMNGYRFNYNKDLNMIIDESSPAEMFFSYIFEGDTPMSSNFSAIAFIICYDYAKMNNIKFNPHQYVGKYKGLIHYDQQ